MKHLLWFLVFILVLLGPHGPHEAFGQSTWVLSQDKSGSRDTSHYYLSNFSIPSQIAGDPVPAGALLDDISIPEFLWDENPANGGLVIDRWNNRAIITNGDHTDLRFLLVDLDNPDNRNEVRVEGNWPFHYDAPITGIAMIYGTNDRPKWLAVTSWHQYSYINLRTDPWTWGHDAWAIPNGGYGVEDLAFGIMTRPEQEPTPILYAVDYVASIWVWNPIEAFKGRDPQPLLYACGTGMYGSSIALDTSNPSKIRFDDNGNRDLSGRVIAVSRAEGLMRDVNHTGQQQYNLELPCCRKVLSMDYSAEIVDMSQFKEEISPIPASMDIWHHGAKRQPLMEVRPGSWNRIEIHCTSSNIGRPYLVYSLNEYSYIKPDGTQNKHVSAQPYTGWMRANRRHPKSGNYFVNLSSILPPSPLPSGTRMYLYAQWIFVPGNDTDFETTNLAFSEPARIAISNTQ